LALAGADLSPLETNVGFEQVAIEVTASVAQHEPSRRKGWLRKKSTGALVRSALHRSAKENKRKKK